MRRLAGRVVLAVSMIAGGCAIEESALHPSESRVPAPDATTADPSSQASPSPTTSPRAPASGSSHTATLDNGLDVTIRALPGSGSVAVVLLFDIGSHHDPSGRSGLAHFAEHLLVTSATDAEPSRTVDEFVAAYPLGWNAQTGSDFTVLATLVEPDALEDELVLAAARLRGVQPTSADVERERGRIILEVDNMFDNIAALAVANRAREQLLPTPADGRRGGQPDVLASVSLEELMDWLQMYGPSNTVLSIAGELDVEATVELVAESFGDIPAGREAVELVPQVDRGEGLVLVPESTSEPMIAVAYAAPEPQDDLYPAFLVAVSRLFSKGQTQGLSALFAPIDQPDLIVISTGLQAGETAQDGFVRVRSTVEDLLRIPLGADESAQAALIFGPLLGWTASSNTYGVAFSQARLPGLRIDPEQLAADLRAVDGAGYLAAIDVLFTTAPVGAAASGTG